MPFVDAIKAVFEKLAGFFDILDLSFFVAGVLCLGALCYGLQNIYKEEEGSAAVALQEHKVALALAESKQTAAKEELENARKERDDAEQWLKEDDVSEEEKAVIQDRRQRYDDAASLHGRASEEKARLSAAPPEPKTVMSYILEANVLLLCVAVYILGLMCFAAGRFFREKIEWVFSRMKLFGLKEGWKADELREHLEHNDMLGKPFLPRRTTGNPAPWWVVYGRLWVELRERRTGSGMLEFQESYTLLRRYWVLNATYDGVSMALLFWACVLEWWPPWDISGLERHGLFVLTVLLALACFREANRFYKNQIHEITATLARAT